jgi:superfamily II DNA/RNA helicase
MKDQDQMIRSNQVLDSLFGKFGFSKLTEIQKKASPIILHQQVREKLNVQSSQSFHF